MGVIHRLGQILLVWVLGVFLAVVAGFYSSLIWRAFRFGWSLIP